jgi:hypothetical protein
MLTAKYRDGQRMRQIDFKRNENGTLEIYLAGRDRLIGNIVQVPPWGWLGQLRLDGRDADTLGDSEQKVVDEFEAWVAAGTPADSPLLRFEVLKCAARMELEECPVDPEARSAPPT